MTLLDRKVLLGGRLRALGGAVIIGIGFHFWGSIEIYLGQTITNYLFVIMVVLFLGRVFIFIGQMIEGWWGVRKAERGQRKQEVS
jgi:hypothetical protein